jgi:hypothetical protein
MRQNYIKEQRMATKCTNPSFRLVKNGFEWLVLIQTKTITIKPNSNLNINLEQAFKMDEVIISTFNKLQSQNVKVEHAIKNSAKWYCNLDRRIGYHSRSFANFNRDINR